MHIGNFVASGPGVKQHGAILGMQMQCNRSPSFRDAPLGAGPESQDSGFDAAHRPGMTNRGASRPHAGEGEGNVNPFLTINWAKIAE